MSGRAALRDLLSAPAAAAAVAAVTGDGPPPAVAGVADGAGVNITGVPERVGTAARPPGRPTSGGPVRRSKSLPERVRTARFTQDLLTIDDCNI
jgi:hypothetical protein